MGATSVIISGRHVPWRVADASFQHALYSWSTEAGFVARHRHLQQHMAWVVYVGATFLTGAAQIVVVTEPSTHIDNRRTGMHKCPQYLPDRGWHYVPNCASDISDKTKILLTFISFLSLAWISILVPSIVD